MPYLASSEEISTAIARLGQRQILWLDTEVADYNSKKPRLSLIQISDTLEDINGDRVVILDVLDRRDAIAEFVETIMMDSAIEKVFHNAKYDLKFLGKGKTQNVTCTLEMAKKIPYYLAPVPNYRLKTLAEQLCQLPAVNKSEQSSDWGQRPLTPNQLYYAQMDAVCVAQIHRRLLQLQEKLNTDPATEDIEVLILRYRQIEHQWKRLDTEMNRLKERLKAAMRQQNVSEQLGVKLSVQTRRKKQVPFKALATLTENLGIDLDLSVTLTKSLQKELGDAIASLPIEEQVSTSSQLSVSQQQEDDLPF